jgi:hypothetical protein
MSSMIKCQECGGLNPASTRICDFCGNVFSVDGKTLVDEFAELNQSFDKLKAFPSPGLLDSFKNNAKFSMPVLTLISLFLTYKINGLFGIPSLIFLVTAIRAFFTKKQNLLGDFKSDKLIFTAQLASLYGLYSKDPSTNARLNQIEKEFKNINGLYKKSKGFEFIAYVILLILFTGAYFVPATKSDIEKAKDVFIEESAYLNVADSLLSKGNFQAANDIIKKLASNEVIIELKSKIQFAELVSKVKFAEDKLNNKDYTAAKSELEPLLWKKNATDIDQEMIEERYYKDYIQLKTNLNNRLPDSYKINVESEIDY